MLLYRVFPYADSAKAGRPGHPLYLNPLQGHGRWDNPEHYLAWYMASEEAAAVGEALGDITPWDERMFAFPQVPGARRALGVYELPDDLPYLDLDDARQLVELGVRPSQVVERNRAFTQSLALRIYRTGRYKGLRWWSYRHPQWRVWCLWEITRTLVEVEELSLEHRAVIAAAHTLNRALRDRNAR